MTSCVIALDVGGTAMKGALIGRDLTVLAELRRPTRAAGVALPARATRAAQAAQATHAAHATRAQAALAVQEAREAQEAEEDEESALVVAAIGDALADLATLAVTKGLTVRGAGVAVPGIVDEAAGRAVRSVNLGWHDLDLGAVLAGRIGMPVALGHDVRSGARAEAVAGAARGVRDVVFVPIGTGISGAVVCDGRVLSGGGYAGEIGHIVVRSDGGPCPCGGRGCLETVASAAAIAARYAARSGRPTPGAAEVVRRLDRGDPLAREIWDDAVDALADALATTATLLAPELIVLGGGLAEAGDRLLVPLRAQLARRLTFQRRPRLVRAALGDRAGCLGAGILAWERLSADYRPPGEAGS